MKLELIYDLPFTTITLTYQNKTIEIQNVLIDTGSATTVLAMDQVTKVGVAPLPDDILYTLRGIGGTEVVFSRQMDFLNLGPRRVANFVVEVGGMDYGFEINGILGMDFLMEAGIILDLKNLIIDFDR